MKSSALIVALISLLVAPSLGRSDEPEIDMEAFNRCLLEKIKTATNKTTVSEIREACLLEVRGVSSASASTPEEAGDTTGEPSPLDERLEGIKATQELDHVITPLHPNYLLVGYNPNPNNTPFQEAFPDQGIVFDEAEIKFQFSFMVPILNNIFKDNGSLYVAYTNRSFFQVFNSEFSAPFRETNHEPELWLQFSNNRTILGFKNRLNAVGFSHQSNGRSEPMSRSWNRLFARLIFERGDLAISVEPWIIFGDRDDNPDISDYMGNVEFHGAYKWNRHTISLMLRNHLQSGFSRGTFQIDWSFPIHRRLRGYTQYFNGYGESLIDYNVHNNTIGMGVSFTDYF